MAENRGFDITLVRDATATFGRTFDGEQLDPALVHKTALEHLEGEFAEIGSTDEILATLIAESAGE